MIRCAIVGATGLVGSTFLKVIEESNLPIDEYVLFASFKSKGKKITFLNQEYIVEELTQHSFDNNRFQYALFSAGGSTSKQYAKIASENGCVVIDNSSTFRMDDDVPLIIPEVNPEKIAEHKGIIANPNCSTIQAVLPLKVLQDLYGIKRIIYSTYQAVSGAGKKGIDDLYGTMNKKEPQKFQYPIFNNCIPQIDDFLVNGYTKEEMKMINETRKILNLPNLPITATCVRVPVVNCHCESINVELEKDFDISELKQALNLHDGIVVLDDICKDIYPLNSFVDGKNDVFVGRIRRDDSVHSGINLWTVGDNVRKGAATNAVQILEKLLKKDLEN